MAAKRAAVVRQWAERQARAAVRNTVAYDRPRDHGGPTRGGGGPACSQSVRASGTLSSLTATLPNSGPANERGNLGLPQRQKNERCGHGCQDGGTVVTH